MIQRKIIALLIAFSFVACKTEQDVESTLERPVKVIEIGKQETFNERHFTGKAEASDAATLAFEVHGKLNKFNTKIGDKVTKGDILASVDSRDFANALDQAKAELKRVEAQYNRLNKALTSNAVSKQQVTDAKAALESVKALVNIRTKALNDTKIVAPFSGVVVSKLVKSYENIQAKQPIIRIVAIDQVEMVVDIPENLISLAKSDMKVLVSFDAFPETIINAHINEIGQEASAVTRTFPVTLIMNQPKTVTILPGMSGKAWRDPSTTPDITDSNLSGYEVPLSAILSKSKSENYVWVFDKDAGNVSKRKIEVGELTNNGVLIKGLSGGELVVTAGVNVLTEGQKVRLFK